MKKIILSILFILFCSPSFAVNYCNDANVKLCVKMHTDESPLTDSSGLSHSGTLDSAGNPAYSSDTPSGYTSGSYVFTSDKITFGDHNDFSPEAGASGAMTGSIWFKFNSLSTTNNDRTWIFTKGNSGEYEYAFYALGNGSSAKLTIAVYTLSGGTNIVLLTGATALSTGTWYNGSFTFDKSTTTTKIYLNGVQDGTSSSMDAQNASNSASSLYLAQRNDGAAINASITETEFGIWSRAFSAAEVLDVSNHGLDGTAGVASTTTKVFNNMTIKGQLTVL